MTITTLLLVASVITSVSADRVTYDEDLTANFFIDQSSRDFDEVLDAYWKMNDLLACVDSYMLYRNKTLFAKLNSKQQNVVLREISCDSRDIERHETMKETLKENPEEHRKALEQLNINATCVSHPKTESEKCFCEPDSISLYCELIQNIHKIDLPDVPYEGEIYNKVNRTSAAMTHFFLSHEELPDYAKAEYDLENGISDLNVVIPEMLRKQNGTMDEIYCLITPEVHHMWKRFKRVSIGNCLTNDEFNRRVRATHSPTFCEENTSFSRCMCDSDSYSLFCYMELQRKLIGIYAEDYNLTCPNASNRALAQLAMYYAAFYYVGVESVNLNTNTEFQTMKDVQSIIKAYAKGLTPAYSLYYNNAFFTLNPEQKVTLFNQMGCEASEEMHTKLKQLNQTAKNAAKRKTWLGNRTCDDSASQNDAFVTCLCEASTDPLYCHVAHTARKTADKRRGSPTCKDALWDTLRVRAPRFAVGLKRINTAYVDIFSETAVNSTLLTNDPHGVAILNNDTAVVTAFCELTIETHRILSELKSVDIWFRLFDDIIDRKIFAQLPVNFCGSGSRFSKCLCDPRSSSFFCIFDLLKQMARIYGDEDVCSRSSSSSLASTIPIIIIKLALYTKW